VAGLLGQPSQRDAEHEEHANPPVPLEEPVRPHGIPSSL
jgi:hypothetical protein